MTQGKIGALIMCGVNPAYTLSNSEEFVKALKSLEMSVCFSMKNDETATHSKYVAASNHYLESWCDYELVSNEFSLAQPVIKTLFDTKQFQEILLIWIDNKTSVHDYIKTYWNTNILGSDSWKKALHDGIYIRKRRKQR